MRGALLLILLASTALGSDVPYRTDSANEDRPWYRLNPGEFPPRGSEHVVEGTLVEADFIRRSGQFRTAGTGELVDFTLLPYATVLRHDTEGDLRDVPIGATCRFSLYQDDRGAFTRVAALLALDVEASPEARKLSTERQQARHAAFLKARGLPCWVDRVEGKRLTVTVFGDPSSLRALCLREGIDPARWASERRSVDAVVANEELRTFNPPVDRRRSRVVEFQPVPTDAHGCGGLRWVIEPDLMLEGFRRGRFLRLFAHPSWPLDDMPFGECLYTESPRVKQPLEEPIQYPYRTDFANQDLPWYRLKPGEFPPGNSDHLVTGELVGVDLARRSGRFRVDRTGELVDFTMPPFGTVVRRDAEGDLADLEPGTRYRFSLYPDARGAFTVAAVISDDSSTFAGDDLSYRLDSIDPKAGKLILSKRHAPILDDKDKLVQPPDLARAEFAVGAETRVWKANRRVALDALAVGDWLRVEQSGSTSTSRGVLTDVWVGPETYQLASTRQRLKHEALLKLMGVPGWVEAVRGKELTVVFFAARRKDINELLDKEFRGDRIAVTPLDDELRPTGPARAGMRFKDRRVDRDSSGTYGCSDVRWIVEADGPVEAAYRPGQVVRVFRGRPPWLSVASKVAEGSGGIGISSRSCP